MARVRALSDELGALQRRLAAIGGLNTAVGSFLTNSAVLVALGLSLALVSIKRG